MPDNNGPASLKKQRTIIKASCTQIKTYIDAVRSVNPSILAQLEERKIKLDQCWADYDNVQTKLELSDDAEARDRATCEEPYYSLAARMREIIRSITPLASIISVASSASPSSSVSRESSHSLTHVRLPKLNLPVFSSKYDEWFPFHDTFISVIHSNATLSNIHKLQYLRASPAMPASYGKSKSAKTASTRFQSNVKKQSCAVTVKSTCHYCQGEHFVYYCKNFLALSTAQKISEARNKKLCANCLRSTTHVASNCTSGGCRVCELKHNTLLHSSSDSSSSSNRSAGNDKASKSVNLLAAPVTGVSSVFGDSQVLLSTAVVYVYNSQGSLTPGRALLDSGSQVNLISKRFLTSLDLKSQQINTSISGISGTAVTSSQTAQIKLQSRLTSYNATIDCILHDQLGRLWQIDNKFNAPEGYTIEERQCEQHFLDNVRQNSQGQYIVKLPVKEHVISRLGYPRDIALKRLRGIEKRLKRDPELKMQYSRFMVEYISLGHMHRIDWQSVESPVSFYLPHHCVHKISGQSSKLRVVFDASCKTSANVFLNDALMVGPIVQQNLMSILLRFRTFRYAITADIIKMYRQILMNPSQTCLQRILWRENPADEVETYESATVTYGTATASYLATRCLTHLADQYSDQYPISSLHRKSFELSKWASNFSKLLDGVDDVDAEAITIKNDIESSILGIHWNQLQDLLYFSYRIDPACNSVSKRTILSEAVRLFDPLGLLGSVTIVARLILQELWLAGTHWDESVPQEIHTRWADFKSHLKGLNDLSVPRCIKFSCNHRSLQIHGFCDASQRAYGACVYVRTEVSAGVYRTELWCSKSRVAPLKTVSLPRLEISAACLLSRLVAKIGEAVDLSKAPKFLWIDSTITLSWVTSTSRRWSVFVANRVGEIQRSTDIKMWRHVSSQNNPADILSRGISMQELPSAVIWWHGPAFLQLNANQWPSGRFQELDDVPEQRVIVATVSIQTDNVVDKLLERHSSLHRICRILIYCLRFSKVRRHEVSPGHLSPSEAAFALSLMCRIVQVQAFPNDYKVLSQGNSVNSNSSLFLLSPFMDKDGLMRVGGRLKNSDLQYDARHQILLPRHHELTRRIIRNEHIRGMHAGAQTTVACVRQRFWPLSLRSTTRSIIQKCITCFKAKPRFSEAIMGSLPAGRVTVSKPFSHCNVDYAGPVTIRQGKRRNSRNSKAYIAIFVCFATRGVHIEVVSDLTSEAFIAAFKRFISRRGKLSHMYSDNGITFVCARNQLKEFYNYYREQQTQLDITRFLNHQEIAWNFIPTNAPHFGGLWEAAVKSAKLYMTRIVGWANLTYEELQTLLSEIEAILNSRPITPLSADPNDLSYLNPGHFLVGSPLNSFSPLDERTKWKCDKGVYLLPNQVVLVKQPNLPPLQWTMGRVLEVHPGSDGVTRTVTIKTAKATFVRPLSRLAILPLDDDHHCKASLITS
ncbi:uncharacterized protein LOC105194004 [Solenopsis invicta]|uniref:uncharacterized protein LOC105194004 n=1 Tax=Solenopsis invicta TaxID=13686 RepID=UPI000595DFC8|nr:uncharacterized protein LOC105194004 [Solenopsis invicta]